MSPAWERLTGCPGRVWQQEPDLLWQLVDEADHSRLKGQIRRCRSQAEPVIIPFCIRHHRSGKRLWILEWRRAVRGPGNRLAAYEGAWLDCTQQKRAEQRLARTAWKEALSSATLGFAHEFNNIFTGILSLSDFFLSQIDSQHPFQEGLTLIRENALRAARLVEHLNQLHRPAPGLRDYHSLSGLASETAEILGKVLPRRISLDLDLHPVSLPVYVDAVELRQAVVYLALNAAEAMPGQGRLLLQTSSWDRPPLPKAAWGAPPRCPAACLSLQDTGPGLPPLPLLSLFDPFVTTKPQNHGTGLGLYCVRLFLEKHHGSISAETLQRGGALFRLFLPEADFSEADAARAAEEQRPKRIFLAGPPGSSLRQLAQLLRGERYQVVVSSQSAAETFQSHDCQFDALILQVADQSSDLLGLLEAARHRQPALPILIQCPHGAPPPSSTDLGQGAILTLPAGLPPDMLLSKLAQALQGPGNRSPAP